ncbi:helix-turn-helix transcriptional regulator [Catenulispora subtropica]
MLSGRGHELVRLAALLDAAAAGRGQALVISGEAGIGKTALLDHAARLHAPRPMLRIAGTEAETDLPFAALHALLHPVRKRIADLPAPQADALRTALGHGSSDGHDRFLVGLALLTLLADLSEEEPLLCLVDDAQWLDQASASALLFALRRLQAERIAVVLGVRTGDERRRFEHSPVSPVSPLTGLPELVLEALDADQAAAVLAEHRGEIAPAVRDRIIAEAEGNPLALIELSAMLGPEQLAGKVAPLTLYTEASSAVGRIESAYRERIEILPERTRTLLTLAAAEGTGDVDLVARAAAHLDAGLPDLAPAEDAGLVRVAAGAVSFRHPLVKAAAYRGATLSARQAAHRALAAALEHGAVEERDAAADRRAHQLAAATTGVDEDLGDLVEQAAARALRRGAPEVAAPVFERAGQLSQERAVRARRLTLAAEAASAAGQLARSGELVDRALRLLGDPVTAAADPGTATADPGPAATATATATDDPGTATPDPGPAATATATADPGTIAAITTDPGTAARLAAVRAAVEFEHGDPALAGRLLVDAVAPIVPAAPDRALALLGAAAGYAWFAGDGDVLRRCGRLAEVAEQHSTAPLGRISSVIRATEQLLADGGTADPGLFQAAMADLGSATSADTMAATYAVFAALRTGSDPEALAASEDLAAVCRRQGRISELTHALQLKTQAHFFLGGFPEAEAAAAEALHIADAIGHTRRARHVQGVLSLTVAVQGDAERCEELARSGIDGVLAPGASWGGYALGLLALGRGDHRAAADRLTALLAGPAGHTVIVRFAVPSLVEARVRLGEPDRAAAVLPRFEDWARGTGRAWALGVVERCHAILDPALDPDRNTDQVAEARFQAALGHHEQATRPFEHARTLLLYGEWLRRIRRRGEAADRLRAAAEIFQRLGAVPWLERATAELTAIGAVRRAVTADRPIDELDKLTAQESQVVRLAAGGASNAEIASQLFLSPRTVGYHLYNAFPKLGVSSRSELARFVS